MSRPLKVDTPMKTNTARTPRSGYSQRRTQKLYRCMECGVSYSRDDIDSMFCPKCKSLLMKGPERSIPEGADADEAYRIFLDQVLDRFLALNPEVKTKPARRDYFKEIPLGISDITLDWAIRGNEPEKRLEVCLIFRRSKDELLEYFQDMKEELEIAIGEELSFEHWKRKNEEPKSTIIRTRKMFGYRAWLDDEELREWAVETMNKFYSTFKPKLEEYLRRSASDSYFSQDLTRWRQKTSRKLRCKNEGE